MADEFTGGCWMAVGSMVESERDDIPDICECNPESFNQGVSRDPREAAANARLMAGAPAMFNILECLVEIPLICQGGLPEEVIELAVQAQLLLEKVDVVDPDQARPK